MTWTFSWARFIAVVYKEFIQMRRDRATFAMMIGIPIMQLIMFGFAINTNPKHLPTVLVSNEQTEFTRRFLSAVAITDYFQVVHTTSNYQDAQDWLQSGDAQFIITIPTDFSHKLVRGERPAILIEADASDPISNGRAIGSLESLPYTVFSRELNGPLSLLESTQPSFELRIHPEYNPLAITQYHIVPGLLGVVLTLTMVIITSLAITRERERGTMENLLSTPARPLEVMLGKIVPYIGVGYVQISVILLCAHLFFHVPFVGNLFLLLFLCLLFIAANLSMGLTFSTVAQNQLQAVQGAMFFFLPSIILSGFMFPFYGMPQWAQWVGSILPLTHFLRIVRGIMLKGNGFITLWPQIWPLILFTIVVVGLGFKRFRQTLD